MGLIKKAIEKLTKSQDPNSPRFRREMAERISGKAIKYVTERINDEDSVIGRGGSLSLKDGDLLVFSSADVLFRCKIEDLSAWELLSKDGVVLTGPDKEHGGQVRTVIAYYVYYSTEPSIFT